MDTYDRDAPYRPPAGKQHNFSEGNEMGFYNAEQEEASLLKQLADRFTLSDNFHQSVLGGTAVNHVMLGTGDAIFWSDGNGNPVPLPRRFGRQSKPEGRHRQPVHGRRQFQQLLRRHPAGRRADRQLPGRPAL